jgi:hypothetical protein
VKYAVLQRMWDLFTAALVNIVKFTIAAGAMTLILGAIYNAPVGTGWRLLFAIVATVIAIMITKPVASFKSMAGLDPTRSYLSAMLRRAGGTAVGVVAGQKLTDRSADATPAGTPGEVTTTYRMQPVEPSMPPLPPPATVRAGRSPAPRLAWAGVEPSAALPGRSVPDHERRALPAPVPVSPNALPPEKTPAEVPPDDAPRPLRPVTVVPIVNGAALRRPVVAEYATFPAVGGQVHTEPPAAQPAGRPTTVPGHGVPQIDPTAATTHPAPVEAPRKINPVDPEPATRRVEAAVAYPTGIVVQNEPGMYRPDRPLRIEEYLRFPEPQVDANGEESWTPQYHAKAAR